MLFKHELFPPDAGRARALPAGALAIYEFSIPVTSFFTFAAQASKTLPCREFYCRDGAM